MATLADPVSDHGVSLRGAGRWLRRLLVVAVFLATLVTLVTHERYVLRADDPMWRHLAPFRWWLLPHVAGGMIAFLVAPFQFSATFRRRYLKAHRWLGRLYMGAVIVSSILSIYIVLAFELQANWWVMGTMGALWLVTTLFAWLAILGGNVIQHRLWIGRSFGLTFTFVLTRIVPDLLLPGLDYVKMTALYWAFIVASLILPDLFVNGRALLPWRQRRS
jgi:hypothetical protein